MQIGTSFYLLLIFSLGNCEFLLDERFKNAKPVWENPRLSSFVQKVVPETFDEITRGERIIGGTPAKLQQFPHQALLFMNQGANWYLCGGSFVRYNWILTAAHCVYGFSKIQVFGGVINSKIGPAHFGAEITNPSHLIAHERYNENTIENDIGMIFLEKAPSDLFLSKFMGAIELPTSLDKITIFDGKTANITGFGKVTDFQQSNVLRWAKAPIISNARCALFFGDTIKTTNICISTLDKKSTCSGDSGGPLTVLIKNKPTLVGVTSFGSALGCTIKAPAAFTRVTEYLDWINNQFTKLP